VIHDVWEAGDAYEAYVGRWSRHVAGVFVPGLGVPPGRRWLDVGCGTGALASTVLAAAAPARVVGVDRSSGFLATARRRVAAAFCVGDARALPLGDAGFDAVISGLALNFVPDPACAAAEFVRVAAPGAVVAAFVWDYAEGMAMMRHFWDVAGALDPVAAALDEGARFPVCRPDGLRDLWLGAGLAGVKVEAIEVPTVFTGFDDYWQPFLGGQGAAPAYVATLDDERRAVLREALRDRLGGRPGQAIPLTARAWTVRGSV
jgi:SAM-dependent methyltransferase